MVWVREIQIIFWARNRLYVPAREKLPDQFVNLLVHIRFYSIQLLFNYGLALCAYPRLRL